MLDQVIRVSPGLELKCHKGRRPSPWAIQKIAATRPLSIRILQEAHDWPMLALAAQPTERSKVIAEIASHHLKFDPDVVGQDDSALEQAKQAVLVALTTTRDGLARPIRLADVLAGTTWDPHVGDKLGNLEKQKGGLEWPTVEKTKITEIVRPDMRSTEGYVAPRKGVTIDKEEGPLEDQIGGIHIHFALAETISRPVPARMLIHEATHRFARTPDVAYIHTHKHDILTPSRAARDADSLAYFAVSMHLGDLISTEGEVHRRNDAEIAPLRSKSRLASILGKLKRSK